MPLFNVKKSNFRKLNFRGQKNPLPARRGENKNPAIGLKEQFLDEVTAGAPAQIVRFEAPPDIALCFMEMGLCVHDKIRILNQLPFGGNLILLSENGKYSIRKQFARWIKVRA